MTRADDTGVKTARTSFAIVEAIAELDGAGISELARHLDRSKGGIHKHVHTLADLGYLVEDDGTYRLGLGFWTLGTDVRDRLMPEQVRSIIDDLAASIGHVVTLVIYESGTAAVVYSKAPATASVQPFGDGDSLPLHATAGGKAILAYLPDSECDSVLEGDLEAYTEATLTDPQALRAALGDVRQQRLARDDGEYDPAVECVAAPIVDSGGYPRGSVVVTSGTEELLGGTLEADASLIVSASKSLENTMTD
ncbi:IclR family transcriptional regulator [Halorhabdus sp. CBA1104]|uniref:IclR family transcriptional regulator n=1 Tax=unclassified Halorhabdus TaxID=2621901 RepID=UPI0012B21EEA|nr:MULTISPECIES: IclR family transcriptional regulator [unclassified Halorhabdus]QGN07250.1 IclR family transcriptional regulator [Halorhabdus sp. CBA1104]